MTDLAEIFPVPRVEKISYKEMREQSAKKKYCILVDIDGTLSLRGGRSPYDWNKVGEDEPNLPIVWIIQRLQLFATILIISGRDESCHWQ